MSHCAIVCLYTVCSSVNTLKKVTVVYHSALKGLFHLKMSRLYDTIEPNVIDEKMLQKAVEEQGPQEELGQLAKREGIDFKDVTQLQLDFRSKYQIFFIKG